MAGNRLWMAALVAALLSGGLLAQAQEAHGSSLATLAEQQRKIEAQQPPAHVYTNSDLPDAGHVASPPPASPTPAPAAVPHATPKPPSSAKLEAQWRRRFAHARRQLRLDEQDLNVTQRELNLSQMQFYANPTEAMHQHYSRSDIAKKKAKVDRLRQQVEKDKQALDHLTQALRRAGLPAGWGR